MTSKVSIDINLSGQEEGKFRTFFLVLGLLGLAWIATSFIFPELTFNFFTWLVFIPSCIQAIVYGLGRREILKDNFPYLRIDEHKIETNTGGFLAKPRITYWDTVKTMEIKLFEIQVTTTDGRVEKIDLDKLTDDNLKIVKEFIRAIKANRQL